MPSWLKVTSTAPELPRLTLPTMRPVCDVVAAIDGCVTSAVTQTCEPSGVTATPFGAGTQPKTLTVLHELTAGSSHRSSLLWRVEEDVARFAGALPWRSR